MVTLTAIIPSLNKEDWLAVLDLQDAYFHIAIHVAHRHFLRFQLGNEHYQIQSPALWSGMCSQGFHQNVGSGCGPSAQIGSDNLPLFG